jgi:hypothetical protein
MYQPGYEQGNVTGMGKAITLQSKLVKILSDQVEHRHGLFDEGKVSMLFQANWPGKTEIRFLNPQWPAFDRGPMVPSRWYLEHSPE